MATKTAKTIKKKDSKKDSGQARMTKVAVRYEVMVVYPLSVNEIAVEKALAESCKKNGFKILQVDKMGIKNLAYSIKKETRGYYLRFEIEGGNVKALDKSLNIDDKILRYIVVKI